MRLRGGWNPWKSRRNTAGSPPPEGSAGAEDGDSKQGKGVASVFGDEMSDDTNEVSEEVGSFEEEWSEKNINRRKEGGAAAVAREMAGGRMGALRRALQRAWVQVGGGARSMELDRRLWAAAESGDVADVFAAAHEGARVNICLAELGPHERAEDARSRATPMHSAAERGDSPMLRALAALGALVDAPDEECRTPLLIAAGAGRLGAVSVLLKLGADPNLKGTPFLHTPLHAAVSGRYEATVRVLLAGGADVNATTAKRETSLHLAAQKGFGILLPLLLIAGVDWDARAMNGWRASTYAQQARFNKLHIYLEKVRRGKIVVARLQRMEEGIRMQRRMRDSRRKKKLREDETGENEGGFARPRDREDDFTRPPPDDE